MLHSVRRLHAPELGVAYEQVDLRTPSFRLSVARTTNATSDYALVDLATPFVARLGQKRRVGLSILLRGRGRFDEDGRHHPFDAGQCVLSDCARGGTEAYTGATTEVLFLEWNVDDVGAPHRGPFALERLAPRDVERLLHASARLRGASSVDGVPMVLDVLRAHGLPFSADLAGDLVHRRDHADDALVARVQATCNAVLSDLRAHPALQDVLNRTDTNARRVHRALQSLSDRYCLPFTHWKGALFQARLSFAMQLLSAPGATTEKVSRATGFRSPSALCHAFAKAGLPSPGVMARKARAEVLEGWAEFGRGTRVG